MLAPNPKGRLEKLNKKIEIVVNKELKILLQGMCRDEMQSVKHQVVSSQVLPFQRGIIYLNQ